MLSLNNSMLAYAGCILACIPCFSPCLILGIPFGIWGLIAMADERVSAVSRVSLAAIATISGHETSARVCSRPAASPNWGVR